MLLLGFMIISALNRLFIRNRYIFTKYCLTQWISKLLGTFEIHWVRQFPGGQTQWFIKPGQFSQVSDMANCPNFYHCVLGWIPTVSWNDGMKNTNIFFEVFSEKFSRTIFKYTKAEWRIHTPFNLDHLWFISWFVFCSEPSHYLNQLWLIVNIVNLVWEQSSVKFESKCTDFHTRKLMAKCHQ